MTLLQDWILVGGRHEKIRAGMRVSAEIKTGDRRVIEYLLSPVMQAAKEAGREMRREILIASPTYPNKCAPALHSKLC